MGRKAGLSLTGAQRKQLQQFMKKTNDKREYRAAYGLLMRAERKSVDDISRSLGVSMNQIFVWTRDFCANGVKGLCMKKPTGRKTTKADSAKPLIAKIINADPQAFGYLKGRWVLRDISRELKKEGVDVHWTSVGRMLDELDLVLKSPRLRALGSIKKNYRKRKEIQRYKRIAPALLKKKFSSVSKMRSGLNSSVKLNGDGQKKDK